jgi:hypothetical protein
MNNSSTPLDTTNTSYIKAIAILVGRKTDLTTTFSVIKQMNLQLKYWKLMYRNTTTTQEFMIYIAPQTTNV